MPAPRPDNVRRIGPHASSGRRRIVALVAAMAVLAGLFGLGSSPASATPIEVLATGDATWGLRASYRWYITSVIAQGSITASDGAAWLDTPVPPEAQYATAKGPFSFPVVGGTYDSATSTGTIELGGSFRTLGHQTTPGSGVWILDSTYSDLKVLIDGTTGTLQADIAFRPYVSTHPDPLPALQTADDIAFGTIDLSGQSLVPDANGAYTITAAPMKGVASTMQLIGWDQFYSSQYSNGGVVLDPLTITFTPDEAPPAAPTFSDVPADHPFFDAVEWMASEGLSTGYLDGTYRPTGQVTRQAAAAFLWRLSGEPAPPIDAPTFSDVAESHDFHDAIAWMAGEGIADGYSDGTFRPTAPVSRQSIAAFLWRLDGEPALDPGAPTFTDVPNDHPFATAIRWLADEGVSDGYPDGTFRPTNVVTRQAMASFLFKSFAI